MDLESRQKYPCAQCDTVLLSKSSLRNHEHIFHSEIIEEHICECGKILATRMKLNQHRLTVHTKGHYPCEECTKVFTQKAVLQKHKVRNHAKKEPCEKCGKMYPPGRFMTTHMKSHGAPQYKCDIAGCNKEFHARSALTYHTESKHASATMLIKCPHCNSVYNSTRNLNRHITRQHNTMRVQCQIEDCTHTAARKDYLVSHYRSHKEIDDETRELLIAKVKDLKVIPW
jgi:KRAB domain-containing zinc finger protein